MVVTPNSNSFGKYLLLIHKAFASFRNLITKHATYLGEILPFIKEIYMLFHMFAIITYLLRT